MQTKKNGVEKDIWNFTLQRPAEAIVALGIGLCVGFSVAYKWVKTWMEDKIKWLEGRKEQLAEELSELRNLVATQDQEIARLKELLEGKSTPPQPKVGTDDFGTKLGTQAAKNNAALTKEPQTMRELMAKSGASDTFYNQMNKLVERGVVIKEDGRYRLP